jgi:hypothetical protein
MAALGISKIAAAGIAVDSRAATLYRAADGKRKQFSRAAYGARSIRQMMKRWLEDAGLPEIFSPCNFSVTVVADLLTQNLSLEDVQ